MGSNWPLLSLLVWLPILGGLATLAFGRERAEAARWFALVVSAATLLLCVPLYTGFDAGSAAMQFVERTIHHQPAALQNPHPLRHPLPQPELRPLAEQERRSEIATLLFSGGSAASMERPNGLSSTAPKTSREPFGSSPRPRAAPAASQPTST